MRKITKAIAEAFKAGKALKIKNTETTGYCVYLHGNTIAEIDKKAGKLYLTLAGWNTVTTRERLNGILETFGLDDGYMQKDFQAMMNYKPVDANEWQVFLLNE